MLTAEFTRVEGWVKKVAGQPAPEHLLKLRIPPAWTDVMVDPNPRAVCVATGIDAAGRKQRLYSGQWIAQAKAGKFERVRALLAEAEDIRTEIEGHINDRGTDAKTREAALVAYLIFLTGMRPGSTNDTKAEIQAYGATTIQLRHVKSCARGVRLKYVGKKGVLQNVLVTNPHLVRLMLARKKEYGWSRRVFLCSAGTLQRYVHTLGSGLYNPKDFRTLRGTSIALDLLGNRKRLPRAKSKRRKIVNNALDKVAKQLGNTRAISRASYVDPTILERFLT